MTPEHKALREAAEKAIAAAQAIDDLVSLPTTEQNKQKIIKASDEYRYYTDTIDPATILSLLDALSASEARVEKARNDALEEAAKVADKYPPNILLQYDRPPNGPPGNQMVPTPPHLIASAIRALTKLTKP